MSIRHQTARSAERFLRGAWSRPIVRAGFFGAVFAGGALLAARTFGSGVADSLGQAGGEGFARGVDRVQRELAGTLGRGSRFG